MATNKVRWEDLDPALYEDMTSVLISRLHPKVQRIDGSGGDGGRDVQVPSLAGLEIFEMKSFTGRLQGKRRTQVQKSLKGAAAHDPVTWHLVVPINPTPAELVWFQKLTNGYAFRCEWLDRTWLDDQMATHPDIIRYYLEGSQDEIVKVLRELNQEQAALTRGAPDAMERLRTLTAHVNELDPHYAFGLASQPDGSVAVSVMPKYLGAESDRPISIQASFLFPDTEEGRAAHQSLNATLDYGVPGAVAMEYIRDLNMDLPGGLGGLVEASAGHVSFGLTPESLFTDASFAMRVLDRDGRAVAQLPQVGKTRSAGRRGAELTLSDASGAVSVTIRVDASDWKGKTHYEYSQPANALPSSLLPAVRLLAEMREERFMVVVIDGKQVTAPTPLSGPPNEEVIGFACLLTALDKIQRVSGVYFALPECFTSDELAAIRRAERLLDGETIVETWSVASMSVSSAGLAELSTGQIGNGAMPVTFDAQLLLHLCGHEVPLGRCRQSAASARIAHWPRIAAGLPSDQDIDIELVPGSNPTVSTTLVPTDR